MLLRFMKDLVHLPVGRSTKDLDLKVAYSFSELKIVVLVSLIVLGVSFLVLGKRLAVRILIVDFKLKIQEPTSVVTSTNEQREMVIGVSLVEVIKQVIGKISHIDWTWTLTKPPKPIVDSIVSIFRGKDNLPVPKFYFSSG